MSRNYGFSQMKMNTYSLKMLWSEFIYVIKQIRYDLIVIFQIVAVTLQAVTWVYSTNKHLNMYVVWKLVKLFQCNVQIASEKIR